MNLIGAFILGGATVIACYELAWWLAERRVPRHSRDYSKAEAYRAIVEAE